MDGKRTYGQFEADYNLKWSAVKKKVREIHHRISMLPDESTSVGLGLSPLEYDLLVHGRGDRHRKAYADRLILLDFLFADLHQFLVLVESMDRKKIE